MRLTDKEGVIVQVNDAFVDWCGMLPSRSWKVRYLPVFTGKM